MKHIALATLIAAAIATMSSCATDQEGLPAASGALAEPGDADKAIVCRFGNVSSSDTDQKKRCTTPKERQEEKEIETRPDDSER